MLGAYIVLYLSLYSLKVISGEPVTDVVTIEAPANDTSSVSSTVGTAVKYENGYVYEYNDTGACWERIN